MKLELFEAIFNLQEQGKSYREIAKEVGRGESYVSNVLSYAKFGSLDEVRELLVEGKYASYSSSELCDIVEEILAQDYTMVEAAMRFKYEFNRIASLLRMRRDMQRPLEDNDLKDIKWCQQPTYSRKEQSRLAQEAKARRAANGTKSLSRLSFDISKIEAAPRVLGKAVTMPRQYRKDKSKATDVSEKLAHKALKTSKKPKDNTPEVKKYVPDINEMGADAATFLDAKGKFITMRGRRPYINPLSEGFEKLPEKVKEKCYKLKDLYSQVQLEFFNRIASQDIPDIVKRYVVAQEIIDSEKYKVSQTMIFFLCGIAHDNVRFVKSRVNRKDKYEDTYKYMQEFYDENDGKLGRISMAILLRTKGHYLCAPTVARLMRKKGLTYKSGKTTKKSEE